MCQMSFAHTQSMAVAHYYLETFAHAADYSGIEVAEVHSTSGLFICQPKVNLPWDVRCLLDVQLSNPN